MALLLFAKMCQNSQLEAHCRFPWFYDTLNPFLFGPWSLSLSDYRLVFCMRKRVKCRGSFPGIAVDISFCLRAEFNQCRPGGPLAFVMQNKKCKMHKKLAGWPSFSGLSQAQPFAAVTSPLPERQRRSSKVVSALLKCRLFGGSLKQQRHVKNSPRKMMLPNTKAISVAQRENRSRRHALENGQPVAEFWLSDRIVRQDLP